jgi:hypothetical protein
MTSLTGHCLCRAITFEVSAPPLLVLHCHCESCRRNTSSPVATFFVVRHDAVHYTQGKPKVFESSPGVRRSFCDRCGSPLAYETDQRPEQIDLYVCSLSDPAAVLPQVHLHAEEQVAWFEILDQLPRYAKSLHNAEPVRIGPRTSDS